MKQFVDRFQELMNDDRFNDHEEITIWNAILLDEEDDITVCLINKLTREGYDYDIDHLISLLPKRQIIIMNNIYLN